jgi:hypothetical protein
MSNGLKVGLLIVIAGALGFLGYSQWKKGSDNIESRPATAINEASNPTAGSAMATNDAKGGSASQQRAKTTINFDKKEHDFGKMKQGDQVECVFKVTNTGNEPLIIEEAHGSCGCTVPDYPKEPIPAGQTRDIKVKFNSAGKKGSQTKTVTLTSNTEPLQTILTIKAEVEVPEGQDKAAKPAGH